MSLCEFIAFSLKEEEKEEKGLGEPGERGIAKAQLNIGHHPHAHVRIVTKLVKQVKGPRPAILTTGSDRNIVACAVSRIKTTKLQRVDFGVAQALRVDTLCNLAWML